MSAGSLQPCSISDRLVLEARSSVEMAVYSGCEGVKTNLGWLHTFCKYRSACKPIVIIQPLGAMMDISTGIYNITGPMTDYAPY